jgi:uncharacterized protein (TIGR03435 family)
MVDLISIAYDMESNRILGGPNWLDWDRFDVVAKAPTATSIEGLDGMLRRMLADRFHLVIHKDTKPMPAFVLTTGKGKSRMKPASGATEAGCKSVPQSPSPGSVPYLVFSCESMTMAAFAETLSAQGNGGYLGDPVVDQTGIEGAWDFEFKWTARNRLAQAGADGISLFDALDKQLDLKLELKKSPLPVLIVDTVNQTPSPNEAGVTAKIPPAPLTEFEVASIKSSRPEATGQTGNLQNGRLDLLNYTLKQAIQLAWNLSNNDEMIVGLPKSAESAHYDIVAKVANTGSVSAQDVDYDTLQLMLRGLLGDRFGLKAHMEDRPVSAYMMTASPPTRLQKADSQNRTNCKKGGALQNPMLNVLMTCQNINMTQFAAIMQNLVPGYIKAPVKDATGLDGNWDFTINWSGPNLLPGAQFDPNKSLEAAEPNGSLTFPQALLKQLGLKLAMEKRPMPVLVVDHVADKPSDN